MKVDIRERDIFSWEYKGERNDCRDAYWGKSQFCIERNGRLIDTFSLDSQHSTSWGFEEAAKKINLKFLGNFNDLIQISKSKAKYYDPSDIVDISHSNSYSPEIYRRKGSEYSAKAMIKLCQLKIAEKKRVIELEKNEVSRLEEIIVKIDKGDSLSGIFI